MFRLCAIAWKRFVKAFQEAQEFQQRVWVVSIQKSDKQQSGVLQDTYVINEDCFDRPMQWMNSKGYSPESIKKVDKMGRSQVVTIISGNYQHSLLRVK
ncbi:MAG TPA: hypothetical protein VIS54_04265 [Psychromonas sp.]